MITLTNWEAFERWCDERGLLADGCWEDISNSFWDTYDGTSAWWKKYLETGVGQPTYTLWFDLKIDEDMNVELTFNA